jgi:hypothetical protein
MTKYGIIIAYGWLAGIPWLITPAAGQAVIPPAEFDHPFDGPLTVTVVKDIETVNKLCNNPKAGLGCAITMNFGKSAPSSWPRMTSSEPGDGPPKSSSGMS